MSEILKQNTLAEAEMRSAPIVSVDRGIAHHTNSFAFDFAASETYYNSLEYEDKPPLEECRIHFSSLGPTYLGNMIPTAYFANPEDSYLADEFAPPAHIILFTGMPKLQQPGVIDRFVQLQLERYARTANNVASERSYRQRKRDLYAYGMQDPTVDAGILVVSATFWSAAHTGIESAAYGSVSPGINIVAGIGTAAAIRLVNRSSRHKKINKLHTLLTSITNVDRPNRSLHNYVSLQPRLRQPQSLLGIPITSSLSKSQRHERVLNTVFRRARPENTIYQSLDLFNDIMSE